MTAKISCYWSEVAAAGEVPCARTGHTIVVVNNKAYMFGGCAISSGDADDSPVLYLADLFELSLENRPLTWTRISYTGHQPKPRDGHVSLVIDHLMYVFGGRTAPVSVQCVPQVVRFSLLNHECESVDGITGRAPSAVGYSMSKINDRSAVTFGGLLDGRPVDDLHLFSFDTRSWLPIKCCRSAPSPRCDHACAVIGDAVYVFGGAAGPDAELNDLYRLNSIEMSWKRIDANGLPPGCRSGHTLVAHRDKDLYLVGGMTSRHPQNTSADEETASTQLHNLDKFSVKKEKWKRALCVGDRSSILCESSRGHCSFISHSVLYVVGGVQMTGEVGLMSVRALKLVNPSERKPICQHLLADDEKTVFSRVVRRPPAATSHAHDRVETSIDNFVSNQFRSLAAIASECPGDNDEVSPHGGDHSVCLRRIATAVQRFEDGRLACLKLLECERREVRKSFQQHREESERWMKEREATIAAEQEKVRHAWDELEKERRKLRDDQLTLRNKTLQLNNLLQQL